MYLRTANIHTMRLAAVVGQKNEYFVSSCALFTHEFRPKMRKHGDIDRASILDFVNDTSRTNEPQIRKKFDAKWKNLSMQKKTDFQQDSRYSRSL